MRYLPHRSIEDFAAMSSDDALALRISASELQRGARTAGAGLALRGRHLAVLCGAGDADDGAALAFERAAVGLGAKVSRLRSSLTASSPAEQVERTARLLGRLYDGIECIGLPADLVRRIGSVAAVPVFEAISTADHPTGRLARGLAEDGRCNVMQAVLVAALG